MSNKDEILDGIVAQIPVGRLGQPDEIAAMVAEKAIDYIDAPILRVVSQFRSHFGERLYYPIGVLLVRDAGIEDVVRVVSREIREGGDRPVSKDVYAAVVATEQGGAQVDLFHLPGRAVDLDNVTHTDLVLEQHEGAADHVPRR